MALRSTAELRNALASADGSNLLELVLAPGAVFPLNGTQLHIADGKRVHLRSTHYGATLRGEGLSRLILVDGGAELTLTRVHLQDGFDQGAGGALRVESGRATLNDVMIDGCGSAQSAGAIWLGGNTSQVVLNDCMLTNVSSKDAAGAIHASAQAALTLSNTRIVGARVETSGNPDSAGRYWAEGGALFLDNVEATLIGATISNTRAVCYEDGCLAVGGAVALRATNLRMMSSSITDATASCQGGSNGGSFAGAIALKPPAPASPYPSYLNMSNSSVSNCSSVSAGHASAGAIYVDLQGGIDVTDSEVVGCSAVSMNVDQSARAYGGAFYLAPDGGPGATFVNSRIIGCFASGAPVDAVGGAFYASKVVLTFVGGEISECSANMGGAFKVTHGQPSANIDGTHLVVNGSVIRDCSAKTAGMLDFAGTTAVVEGTTVSGCSAKGQGGVMYAHTSGGSVRFIRSTMTGCYVRGVTDVYLGGTLCIHGAFTVHLIDSSISGSFVYSDIAGTSNGGAVAVAQSSIFYLTRSSIVDSHCDGPNVRGGAIWLMRSTLHAVNSSIVGSYTRADTSLVEATRSAIMGGHNYIVRDKSIGGAISAQDESVLHLVRVHITGSYSSGPQAHGGALALEASSTATFTAGSMSGCQARGGYEANGGAVVVETASTIDFELVDITACSATSEGTTNGGGLSVVTDSTAILTNVTVSQCAATSSAGVAAGGALHVNGSALHLSRSTLLDGNQAPKGAALSIIGDNLIDYVLPAPAGTWLPGTLCQVNREQCPKADAVYFAACTATRTECSRIAKAMNASASDGTPCMPATFNQPCAWHENAEQVGEFVFVLPSEDVTVDFPFSCAPGIVGSAEVALQLSPLCAGLCPAGKVCGMPRTMEPTPCERGKYCPISTSKAVPCPSGTRMDGSLPFMTSASDCLTCDPGYSCSVGAEAQQMCLPGSVGATAGQAICSLCSPGSFQREYGQTACAACTAGFYCKEGAAEPVPVRQRDSNVVIV